MHEPDPRILRSAAAGDTAAFADLVRGSQAHVWRFIRHLVGDDELAADLTQETLVRVHRALGGFRHESRFSTWLFRIARHVVIDEQRRAARRPRPASTVEADTTEGPTLPSPSLGTELAAALATLTEVQREAFVLVEVFGLTYREVAEVTGIAEGTAKSRVFHARAALVRWFDTGEEVTDDGTG